jgi:predicted PurR-regulated permease PerM
VLIGNGVGSVVQGIVGGIAMMLVGLPSPVLWGTVMSIAAFLPVFGVSVVVIPAGIYLILQGQTAEGVAFIAICLSVALVLENVLKTKLMGFGVRVHDVPLFLGILGGLAGFGLLGLLYGPLIVALFLTLTDLYMSHYRPQFAARFARRKSARGNLY